MFFGHFGRIRPPTQEPNEEHECNPGYPIYFFHHGPHVDKAVPFLSTQEGTLPVKNGESPSLNHFCRLFERKGDGGLTLRKKLTKWRRVSQSNSLSAQYPPPGGSPGEASSARPFRSSSARLMAFTGIPPLWTHLCPIPIKYGPYEDSERGFPGRGEKLAGRERFLVDFFRLLSRLILVGSIFCQKTGG